jgi:energy-coupling factor transporter ATP-binding protein EcfA2
VFEPSLRLLNGLLPMLELNPGIGGNHTPELTIQANRRDRALRVRDAITSLVDRQAGLQLALAAQLAEVWRERHWEVLGFASFHRFLRAECPRLKIRKAQQLVAIHETFIRKLGLSRQRIKGLPWSKVGLVTACVTNTNLEELLADVERLSVRELRRKYGYKSQVTPAQQTSCRSLETSSIGPGHCVHAVPGVWRLPQPAEQEFYIKGHDWEQLCYANAGGKPVLIVGPSGCGKTELAGLAAKAAGRPIETINFGGLTSEPRSGLIGNTHFSKEKGTWFQASRFVRALQSPRYVILIDELSRAGTEAFNLILPLLDGQRCLSLDESEGAAVIHLAPDIAFVATANQGTEYTGAQKLDWALQNRFAVLIELSYPPVDKEIDLLRKRCVGLPRPAAVKLVEFADRQRNLAYDGDYLQTISTRMLLEAGAECAAGIAVDTAALYCIVNHFSAEGGDVSNRAKLLQLWQKS